MNDKNMEYALSNIGANTGAPNLEGRIEHISIDKMALHKDVASDMAIQDIADRYSDMQHCAPYEEEGEIVDCSYVANIGSSQHIMSLLNTKDATKQTILQWILRSLPL